VTVIYKAAGAARELSVCDEGEGVPTNFDPAASNGLGMKVVGLLAKQLGGKLTVSENPSGRGACFQVPFGTRELA
jgi:two-component sensor histidine kinase